MYALYMYVCIYIYSIAAEIKKRGGIQGGRVSRDSWVPFVMYVDKLANNENLHGLGR